VITNAELPPEIPISLSAPTALAPTPTSDYFLKVSYSYPQAQTGTIAYAFDANVVGAAPVFMGLGNAGSVSIDVNTLEYEKEYYLVLDNGVQIARANISNGAIVTRASECPYYSCNGRGIKDTTDYCSARLCKCFDGWGGQNCDQQVECAKTCTTPDDTFVTSSLQADGSCACDCPAPWSGDSCQICGVTCVGDTVRQTNKCTCEEFTAGNVIELSTPILSDAIDTNTYFVGYFQGLLSNSKTGVYVDDVQATCDETITADPIGYQYDCEVSFTSVRPVESSTRRLLSTSPLVEWASLVADDSSDWSTSLIGQWTVPGSVKVSTPAPTAFPTAFPTREPTLEPTTEPTGSPLTASPTREPTKSPTKLGTQAAVCENLDASLACTDGTIKVTGASFGYSDDTLCTQWAFNREMCGEPLDATSVVAGMCDKKSTCMFPVNADTLGGDPCAGVFKYLTTSYLCVGIGGAQEAAPGDEIPLVDEIDAEIPFDLAAGVHHLRCPEGTTISIEEASFGSDSCPQSDVKQYFAGRCGNELNNSCRVNVNSHQLTAALELPLCDDGRLTGTYRCTASTPP
jgi:hypothetical protein